ncbi:MAG: zinc ribbon domain-containing protein [Clostridia bacterium]|nr:zinc ribbon domain-containing protein [Clostridia bacterium]
MDFFNKLGKKTNEVYQGAKEKTAKISEEIKIRTKISDLKDKVNDELLSIGQIVYEKMKSGEDASKEEIVPKCDEVSILKDEILKLETNILALKNMKKCAKCGLELNINAEFCSKCGTAQPKVEEVKTEITQEPEKEVEEVEVTEVVNEEEVTELENEADEEEGNKEN